MAFRGNPYFEPVSPVGSVTELFAGVGGFRIGLANAGWKTVFSNQWEPSTKAQHASEVYEFRFGSEGHSNEDIQLVIDEHLRSISKKSSETVIPETDLLVGGFPCQDYSVAKTLHTSLGLAGKKGVLWWEIHRLVSANKPKFVFLENVDRLLKSPASQRGRDFAVMLRTLGDLGYGIEWRVVNAAEYGFPQRRIRVFIVAKRIDMLDASWEQNAGDFLTSQGVLARAFPIETLENLNTFELDSNPEEISDSFGRGKTKSPFLTTGRYRDGIVETGIARAVAPSSRATLKDVLEADESVPEEFWVTDPKQLQEWKRLKGAKNEIRIHKASGTEYRYNEGSMAYPDLLENPSRTILTGEGGASPSRFKHIVKTEKGFRRLMPVELERLNGFPDGWTEFGANGKPLSDARRAFFMGNALVVGLIEKVGIVLAQDLQNSKSQ